MAEDNFLPDEEPWVIFDPLAQFKHKCAACGYVRVKQGGQKCSVCSDLEALPDKINQNESEQ